MQTGDTTKSNKYNDDFCINPLSVKCWILPLFKLVRILFEVSNALFLWIISTDNIKTVLGNSSLYTIWAFVRDLLNMTFIMVLLFSAFCTIFQIEQYNYKKLLWKIVLMALLVNFSYPITRFIIDFSNILMYSLLNANLFEVTVKTGLVSMAKTSAIYNLLVYDTKQYPDTASLLAGTVMLFMLAITFIAIGALLLIRLIALTILIIFSPIAFVGTILPGASSYASQWWDNLFKYSFFGPIMILGVIISIKFMATIGPALGTAAESAASPTEAPTFIGTLVLVAVPIVLLWMVMGIAQKMSIAGAGAVMGGAQKVMKGAGKKFSGYNAIKRQYDAYAGERKKRMDEKNKHRVGGTIGKWANRTQDTIIGGIPLVGGAARKRAEKMKEDERRDDMDKNAKKSEDTKTTVTMVNNVNSAFNTTGTIDPTRKISDEEAGDAKAFTRKSSDDKKNLIESEFQGKGVGYMPPALANVFASATPEVQAALVEIRAGTHTESDLRRVAAHIHRQMEEVTKKYVKQ